MDFSALFTSLQSTLGTQLPHILGAIGILVLGWVIAVVVRAGVRRLLAMLSVNQRIKESTGQMIDVLRGMAIGCAGCLYHQGVTRFYLLAEYKSKLILAVRSTSL